MGKKVTLSTEDMKEIVCINVGFEIGRLLFGYDSNFIAEPVEGK